MSTTTLDLKVTADARSAVSGLKPLQTSLDNVTKDAAEAESALKDLDRSHKINLNDQAIDTAQKEIQNLRQQMAKDLSVDATADVRQAQTRIRQLQSAVRTLDAETVSINASVNVDESDLKDLSADLGEVTGSAGGGGFLGAAGGAALLSGRLASLARFGIPGAIAIGVGAIGTAAYKTLAPLVSLADQMENAKIAFTQFLGTETKADKFLNNLEQFAAKTPFEFPDLVDASKKLLAFGIEGDDVIGTMTTLGDAAALTGADVNELATIWGQMAAKGRVSNEELLQLTENGIPAYEALAKSMGKTPAQIAKMAEEGKLLADTTLPKLKKGLDATFGGGMAKQAETLSGKWSTIKDQFTAMGTDIGAALLPFVKVLVDQITPALENLTAWVSANKGLISISLTEGMGFALDTFAAVIDVMGSITTAIGTVIEWVGRLTIGIGTAQQMMSDLPGIPDDFGDTAVAAGNALLDVGKGAQVVGDTMHVMAGKTRDAGDEVRKWGQDMAEGFKADNIRSEIASVNTELEKLRKKPPSPRVDAKIDAAEAKLKKLKGDLKDITRPQRQAEIDADISKGQKKIRTIRASLAYLRKQKPTPQIKADIREWERKLKKVRRDTREAIKKKTAPIDAKITGAQEKTKKIKRQLAELGKKKSTPEVKAKTEAAQKKLRETNRLIERLKDKKIQARFTLRANVKPLNVALEAEENKRRRAEIAVTAPNAKKTGTTIDNVAKPGGNERKAPIRPEVLGAEATRTTLDTLARDRVLTITVNYERGTGNAPGGGTDDTPDPDTRSIVPQLFGTETQRADLRTAGALMARTTPMVAAAPTTGRFGAPAPAGVGTVTQLAPREVPVKVYIDGEEVASRIEVQARRFGTPRGRRRP